METLLLSLKWIAIAWLALCAVCSVIILYLMPKMLKDAPVIEDDYGYNEK